MNFSFVSSRRAMVAVAGFTLSAALLLDATSGHSAPATKSVAKKNTKNPIKPIAGKAASPVVAGLKLKGKGECTLNATLSSSGANLLQTSFRTQIKDEDDRDYLVSSGTAAENNNIAVVVLFPVTKRQQISAHLLTEMGATLTLAARQGFKAGQTFPIEFPTSKKLGTGIPLCIMDLVQYEYKSDLPIKSDLGRQRAKTRSSTWIADGGELRLKSVGPQRITFSINARFKAVKSQSDTRNQARGSFVLKGVGEFNVTEVDDGFR